MKNKKIAALVIVLVVAAVVIAGGVFAANRNVDEVKMTEVVTVTDAPQEGEEMQAQTEEEAVIEIVDIAGTITEITDEYVLIDAGELGMIQANTTDDTLIEGVEELAVGQTAVILYDGKMTRSLPAQITALKIGVYEVKGTVTEIADGRMIIANAGNGEETVLTLPESMPEIAVGDAITAYTTGVSTMSLPPQMNAIAVVK